MKSPLLRSQFSIGNIRGEVVATDGYNYRVHKFTSDGDVITKWVPGEASMVNSSNHGDLKVREKDNL